MPEGRPSPGDPAGPETIRRLPTESADLALQTPSSGEFTDPQSTVPETFRSSGPSRPAETRFSESMFPSTGNGTGGSFVEQGDVAIAAGQFVFNKYEVLERLGRGGMGEVWLVRDVELDVKRALKMITQGTAFNSDARARFRREARAMAQFSHRNVVTVHDSRLDMRDKAYIVMEYIPGESLEKVLQPGQAMPLDWVFRVLSQLCEALQVAHRRGIIHRDLKPSNLILVDDDSGGEVLKVLDFGIAKILGSDETTQDIQTMVGAFMGTPPYASPEQASGHAEPLSDIYSVGVILYEALTGHRPFRGKPAELIAQTLFTPPSAFAEVNPRANVPPEIERVVLRCLAKAPEGRPQSPLALLEEFKAAMPGFADTLPPKDKAPEPPKDDTPEPRPVPQSGPSRRALLIGLSIASAALVIGLALALLLRRSSGPVPPSTKPDIADLTTKTLKPSIDWKGRPFTLWNGVYLPDGYKPYDPTDLDDGHPRMLVRGDDVTFVWIKGGKFLMGARGKPNAPETDCDSTNQPAHTVVVPGFYIQKFEVTNGELRDFDKGRKANPAGANGVDRWRNYDEWVSTAISPERAAKHPAREVTWRLATEFAKKRGGWLPTEAQWEFAARSGETARVLVWDEEKGREVTIDRLANLNRLPNNNVWTSEGGEYPEDRTVRGVMDMAGNVREWCRDRWIPYSEASNGPSAELPDDPTDDPEIVVRGGSYNLDPSFRYVTRRGFGLHLSDAPPGDVGFRMVIECPDASSLH